MNELQPPDQSEPPDRSEPSNRKGVTVWQVLHSTLAAALGVQSRKNRARDFEHGKASHFIIAAILFTLVFIGILLTIVRAVLSGT